MGHFKFFQKSKDGQESLLQDFWLTLPGFTGTHHLTLEDQQCWLYFHFQGNLEQEAISEHNSYIRNQYKRYENSTRMPVERGNELRQWERQRESRYYKLESLMETIGDAERVFVSVGGERHYAKKNASPKTIFSQEMDTLSRQQHVWVSGNEKKDTTLIAFYVGGERNIDEILHPNTALQYSMMGSVFQPMFNNHKVGTWYRCDEKDLFIMNTLFKLVDKNNDKQAFQEVTYETDENGTAHGSYKGFIPQIREDWDYNTRTKERLDSAGYGSVVDDSPRSGGSARRAKLESILQETRPRSTWGTVGSLDRDGKLKPVPKTAWVKYGTTNYSKIVPGDYTSISPIEAQRLMLEHDVVPTIKRFIGNLKKDVEVTDDMIIAVTSASYQCGPRALLRIAKVMNRKGSPQEIYSAFL